ncbi:MAG: Mur ligase family protein [Gammaproteobacteria bacterium]
MKPKTLPDWLAYIESTSPSNRWVLGLDRVITVAMKKGLHQFSCPVITVAGTNGKGTTVAGISALLLSTGLRVGAYFSPHLFHFTERIQIDGTAVDEELLLKAFETIEILRGDTPLTYFEFITLVAFQCYQWSNLDVLVLEVGLGGRLDAVNCVSPDIAVITSVDYDHCEWLGSDLESIGREKAGICRPNIPLLLGREAILSSVLDVAASMNAIVYQAGKDFDWEDNLKKTWKFQGKVLTGSLQSTFAESNLLAMAAANLVLKDIASEPPIDRPIVVEMPGRHHVLEIDEVTYILDVAHNPHGARWLSERVSQSANSGRLLAVWSSFKDKDLQNIATPFVGIIDEWFIGPLNHARGANLALLADTLKTCGANNFREFSSIIGAFEAAKQKAIAGDTVLIFGSFETVASVANEIYDKKES